MQILRALRFLTIVSGSTKGPLLHRWLAVLGQMILCKMILQKLMGQVWMFGQRLEKDGLVDLPFKCAITM